MKLAMFMFRIFSPPYTRYLSNKARSNILPTYFAAKLEIGPMYSLGKECLQHLLLQEPKSAYLTNYTAISS